MISIVLGVCSSLSLICAAVWALTLSRREKALTKLASETRGLLERMQSMKDETEFTTYTSRYTLTEADYNRPYAEMRQQIRKRLGEILGRRVAKDMEMEVISNGEREVEYKISIEVKK